MIRFCGPGLIREVTPPVYGKQDRGHSPGGAQDRFAEATARILLGESPEIQTWEMVAPPELEVTRESVGVVTGGKFTRMQVASRSLGHGQVFHIRAGERIRWGIRAQGFRSLLALRPATPESLSRVGIRRGDFRMLSDWRDPDSRIRLIPGPEWGMLQDPEFLLQSRWRSHLHSGEEGVRLESDVRQLTTEPLDRMVSVPVADGTVQLTPDGLIVLLRCRPTHGGYPRIGCIADVDVDLLAQLPPRREIRFRLSTLEEARQAKQIWKRDLDGLRARFPSERPSNFQTDRH